MWVNLLVSHTKIREIYYISFVAISFCLSILFNLKFVQYILSCVCVCFFFIDFALHSWMIDFCAKRSFYDKCVFSVQCEMNDECVRYFRTHAHIIFYCSKQTHDTHGNVMSTFHFCCWLAHLQFDYKNVKTKEFGEKIRAFIESYEIIACEICRKSTRTISCEVVDRNSTPKIYIYFLIGYQSRCNSKLYL